MKHGAYTALIDDDHEFEEEEAWLGECQENFMEIEYRTKVYLDMCDEGKRKIESNEKGVSSKETIHVAGSEGISAMHATSTPLHDTSNKVTATLSRSPQSLSIPQVAVSMILTRTPPARAARSITVPVTLSRPLISRAQTASWHKVIVTALTLPRL